MIIVTNFVINAQLKVNLTLFSDRTVEKDGTIIIGC